MSFHDRTANVAKGKWRDILLHFGVPQADLNGRQAFAPLVEVMTALGLTTRRDEAPASAAS